MSDFEFSIKTKNHTAEIENHFDFYPFLMSTLRKNNPQLMEELIDKRQSFLAKETAPKKIVEFLSSPYKEAPKTLLKYAKAYVEYDVLREECRADYANWKKTNEEAPTSKAGEENPKEK